MTFPVTRNKQTLFKGPQGEMLAVVCRDGHMGNQIVLIEKIGSDTGPASTIVGKNTLGLALDTDSLGKRPH